MAACESTGVRSRREIKTVSFGATAFSTKHCAKIAKIAPAGIPEWLMWAHHSMIIWGNTHWTSYAQVLDIASEWLHSRQREQDRNITRNISGLVSETSKHFPNESVSGRVKHEHFESKELSLYFLLYLQDLLFVGQIKKYLELFGWLIQSVHNHGLPLYLNPHSAEKIRAWIVVYQKKQQQTNK